MIDYDTTIYNTYNTFYADRSRSGCLSIRHGTQARRAPGFDGAFTCFTAATTCGQVRQLTTHSHEHSRRRRSSIQAIRTITHPHHAIRLNWLNPVYLLKFSLFGFPVIQLG